MKYFCTFAAKNLWTMAAQVFRLRNARLKMPGGSIRFHLLARLLEKVANALGKRLKVQLV